MPAFLTGKQDAGVEQLESKAKPGPKSESNPITNAAANAQENGEGRKKRYPQGLRRDSKTALPSDGLAGMGVGLGLRTDSGSNLFMTDQSGGGGVVLRKKIGLGRVEAGEEQVEREQPRSAPVHEQEHAGPGRGLESLENLLHQAGYKETRVFTPERPVPARASQVQGQVGLGVGKEEGGKRLRLDVGLLNRRVQQQQQQQPQQQVVTIPLPGPVAVGSSSAPIMTQQQQRLRQAPSRSGLRKEIKVVEKRICSAPAFVPTLSARGGPSSSTADDTTTSTAERPSPVVQAIEEIIESVRATPPEHALQRSKAQALQGMDWADIEDSLEEASPGPASGSRNGMMTSNEHKVQDTPSPAMRYKASRLRAASPMQGDLFASPSEVSEAANTTANTTPVSVEELFGRREDGTLFYPPIAPRARGYPGQPGARNEVPVYAPISAYPLTAVHPQLSSGSLAHGQPFPNPHLHQYQYRPPVMPVAPLDPLPPMDMDVLTLRKMRSEADIKIREVERRAEAEEMGRGWKETVAPVPALASPNRHDGAMSELSASGTERKRKVLNRVELEFRSVDIDSLSDLSSEIDEDETNIDVIIREEEAQGVIFGQPVMAQAAEGLSDPASSRHSSDLEERFDPAAYENGEDVEMVDVDSMYSSDDGVYHQEYAVPTLSKEVEATETEQGFISSSYESVAEIEADFAATEPSASSSDAFADAEVTVSTPKSSKIASVSTSPRGSPLADVGSPASFASHSSRDSVVRARGLRHAMSTPLFNMVSTLDGEPTRLSKANVQKFTAVGLGKPSAPLLPGQDSWLGKISQRMWSAGTSVMSNTSRDDHSGPTRSAQRPLMPRAMTALATAQRLPASPKVVRAGAIVCDSMESEDMPPVPVSRADLAAGLPFRALRTKLSLQMMGKVGQGMDLEQETAASSSKTPTLTPRPDWHDRDAKWANRPRPLATPTAPAKQTYQWTTNIDEVEGMDDAEPDFSQSFFYKPATPPRRPGQSGQTSSSNSREPKRQESIKSLRALLLKGVMAAKAAKDNIPPVPSIPSAYRSLPKKVPAGPPPPVFAISSPGAVEAGLPPRELVLEGEEWEGGSYESRKEQEKKLKKLKRKTSLRRNF